MSDIKLIQHNGFTLGVLNDFSKETLSALTNTTTLLPDIKKGPLGGRGYVSRTVLPEGIGKVIVKRYTHGGVWGHIDKCYYFRTKKYRPEFEMKLLAKVSELSVNVPRPIAFIIQGRFLYKAWLITQEIENETTLAQLSITDEERAREIMLDVRKQISTLIKNRICHVDLHPGNVLINPENKAYIIDFDRAYIYKGSLNSLRDYYLCRWRRAVIKHELPDFLSELLCVKLLRNYERE